LNLSDEDGGGDIISWLWRIPDEEMAGLGLLSSFKIALESLSDDPSLKSGKREAPSPILILL